MSKPLDGIKFAATFIDDQTEGDLLNKIRSLRGEFFHKMESNVKFLIVGKRYTQKYIFALKHGITLISADVFFSVYMRWKSGEDLDFVAELLDQKLKPFAGQFICLSNMESKQKEGFHELIESGGGKFSIPFTRSNTILVSPKASGRKVDGAHKWRTPVVHPKWISDSIKFGAALDPELYNVENPNAPMEPPEVISDAGSASGNTGLASDSIGNGTRPESKDTTTNGTRTSNGSNTEHLTTAPVLKRRRGGDFLTSGPLAKRDRSSIGPSIISFSGPPPASPKISGSSTSNVDTSSTFRNLRFHFEGFDSRQTGILNWAVKSMGGIIDSTNHEYLVVYSNAPVRAGDESIKIVTEWAVERSMHLKRNTLDDPWSRPVFSQPAEGFKGLKINVTGFKGIEQRHAPMLINMLGATFVETLTSDRDLLIASSDKARKVPYAIAWRVPVASIDWLWKCALAGKVLPLSAGDVLDGKGPRPPPTPKVAAASNIPFNGGTPQLTTEIQRSMRGTGSGFWDDADDDNGDKNTGNHSGQFRGGNIRYQDDDDAEARAQVLVALGERPSTPPEPEPETTPAMHTKPRRRI